MSQFSEQADNHNTEGLIPVSQWGENEIVDLGLVETNFLDIKNKIVPYKPRIIAVTKYYGLDAIKIGYKIGLRNKIAQKINFANVIGDGTCVVSFNIASNGALQNRKFQQQSDNFTLNDVVYNAVMQTPAYNPPPTGYRNETMRLTVKMINGNFEVSLR